MGSQPLNDKTGVLLGGFGGFHKDRFSHCLLLSASDSRYVTLQDYAFTVRTWVPNPYEKGPERYDTLGEGGEDRGRVPVKTARDWTGGTFQGQGRTPSTVLMGGTLGAFYPRIFHKITYKQLT